MEKIKYLFKRIINMDFKACINTANKVHKKNNKNRLLIFIDIIYCGFKYQAGYTDYYLFEMFNLNKEQRKTIITRGINNALIKKYNNINYNYIFNDKVEFNKKFSKYLNRDWLLIDNNFKEFENFAQKHNRFMAKPTNGQCGKGIELIEVKKNDNLKKIFNKLKKNNQDLIEEVAIQCKKISDIHPTSINTIRAVTLKGKVVTSYLRMGNHNKIVDNFNSEGLAAPVNIITGKIEYPAIDKHDNLYERHPITNKKIVGLTIPKWQDVIKLCESAAKEIPEMGYIGWDVCVGEKKVFFIEANEFPGHDIYQLPPHRSNGIGLYPTFKKALEEEQ